MAERRWTTRPMQADDFERVRALYAAVRDTTRPEAYDRWRLLDNPVAFPPAMLAMDGERCAGLYLLWPVRLQLGSEVVLGAQSVDTMTHPDYRNQGMFAALARECLVLAAERGFQALYGFPNPLSYPGFVRRLNWDHTGDIAQWVRIIRPSGLARVPRALAPLADRLAGWLPAGIPGDVEVRPGPVDPEILEELRQEWRARKDLCRVSRDADWMAWRTAPDSQMDYEWLTAWRGGQAVAAVAWGLRGAAWGEQGDGRAKLMETLGADSLGLRAAIATAIARAAASGAWMIETMTNLEPVTTILRRLAFVSHRKAPFIVRGLSAACLGGNIHHHPSWRIVGADVDTF
ncbi:MAG: GNAT family N-acetyltransferase [Alphaproteobacteria bacterium]|nr:GNAT family N-acetyltransferase [Alphaproteobacteria bacterium]